MRPGIRTIRGGGRLGEPPVLTAGEYLIGETDVGGSGTQFGGRLGHFFEALESITERGSARETKPCPS